MCLAFSGLKLQKKNLLQYQANMLVNNLIDILLVFLFIVCCWIGVH